MIHVSIQEAGFTVTGHANYAEHGRDIVCAGVSALAQSVAHACMLMLEDSTLDVKDGLITYQRKIREYDMWEYILLSLPLQVGIIILQRQYPDYIKVDIGGKVSYERI